MTSQVTAAELGRLRADSSRWFTETVDLMRIGSVANGKGGYANTRSLVWSGRVQRKPLSEVRGGREQDIGDLATATSFWVFSFPAGVEVKPSDEIQGSGRTYDVTSVMDKSVEIARYVTARERL